MKIALIWPHGFNTRYALPLPLGYLKSNLDKKHEVKIFDCSFNNLQPESSEFKKFVEEFNPEIVGVSCWSHTLNSAIKILEVIKSINPKIITVMGGVHPTSYHQQLIKNKFIDFLFRGEGEIPFNHFVEKVEAGSFEFDSISGLIYKDKDGAVIANEIIREKDLDKIKIPDYDAIGLREYINQYNYKVSTTHKQNAPIWSTRGCPYQCNYCSVFLQNGRIIRKHSVDYLINWVKYLYYKQGTRHISILDDNFTFDIEYAKEFCKEIIKLNLKGLTIGTPNGVRMERLDDELLHLMKKAKWEYVLIAPESGSERTLKLMNKNLDTNIVLEKVKMIKKAGLKVHGTFMLGYPNETEEDIKKNNKIIKKV